jgi:UDP-N-acetylmuramoyl-tripeptide--D-alanyl-D-alanine ligase
MKRKKDRKMEILKKVLQVISTLILKKYNPRVISITGSVGKTSTKEAIFSVLANKYRVRRSEKNYNNEIGLPLTIIGVDSGKSSHWEWLKVFCKGLVTIIFPVEYPEVLVLEMGADRPGDIKYLSSLVRSDVGVVTEVSPSHIEFFKTLEGIAKEKMTLVTELDVNALALINVDNELIAKHKEHIKARTMTYGFKDGADLQATDLLFNYANDEDVKGLSFKLNYKGTILPVRLNNVLAKHQIYSALAATAVGLEFGLNLVEIAGFLANFSLPCARLNLIGGIKRTSIIDDTYNASPASVVAAVDVLSAVRATRKIAVLGDMLELGEEAGKAHRAVGKKILESRIDIFFGVGEGMKAAVMELKKNGFPEKNIFQFDDPITAGIKLQEIMQEGDLVLIKGSQGLRMEKVVEEVMAEPQKAGELLCRQNEEWKNIPFRKN